ncbi:ArsR/SmtB family transcription factor [Paracoccaceae bacterium GXU_MW_L88]
MNDDTAILALGALAHADRLRAFRLLVKTGPDGLASGELARQLDIAPTRMSFHLGTLQRAGLITSTRSGQQMRYRLQPETMRTLMGFLTEDCCDGRPDLCFSGDC